MLRETLSAVLLVSCASLSGAVVAAPDDARAEAREIFAHLVALKTSEGLGQVPVMAKYLAGKLRAAGFPEEDIHILPLGETASFVARYRGDGSGGRPILLTAHMDVVTANPEEWERDPFTLIEENGYFFGRGTLDIKADRQRDHHHLHPLEARRIRTDARPDHRFHRRRGDRPKPPHAT